MGDLWLALQVLRVLDMKKRIVRFLFFEKEYGVHVVAIG